MIKPATTQSQSYALRTHCPRPDSHALCGLLRAISVEEAKVVFMRLALATLVAELEQIALQNLLVSRLEGRVVHADGRPN